MSLPVKSLKLIYYFMVVNESDFREGLEKYYCGLYREAKWTKLEVLDGEIYLNGFTLAKCIAEARLKGSLTKNEAFNLMKGLKERIEVFDKIEVEKKMVRVERGLITGVKGERSISPHYTYEEKGNTIHGTKNTNFIAWPSQRIQEPMSSFYLENAKRPGTVITSDVGKFSGDGAYMWVEKNEISMIKYLNQDIFSLNTEDFKIAKDKHDSFLELFLSWNLPGRGKLVTQLSNNLYRGPFMSASDGDIIDAIDTTYGEQSVPYNDYEMKDDDLETLLEEFYSMNIFNENTKIHMSLKINLDEFLIFSGQECPVMQHRNNGERHKNCDKQQNKQIKQRRNFGYICYFRSNQDIREGERTHKYFRLGEGSYTLQCYIVFQKY
ncbi:UNKNOWN [Stylonychia lemnae]|uniref:Uncharacterized protein n=1 Tax=Stylonychia lemnae TaxID=5949 RepID=A0A078A9Y5_STYLE|nr:UNKNOWN [Stylonychia lemnae]|eukprot:CDW79080.1 UNKNOWN [Stylonychia lemnae]